jgi:hypothetical protein
MEMQAKAELVGVIRQRNLAGRRLIQISKHNN